MKRLPAPPPCRGFFTLPVAITILAVSGGLALLAGPPRPDTAVRPGVAQPPVRANDVAAIDEAAKSVRHARPGDAPSDVVVLLP